MVSFYHPYRHDKGQTSPENLTMADRYRQVFRFTLPFGQPQVDGLTRQTDYSPRVGCPPTTNDA